jgi:hypothetical protein
MMTEIYKINLFNCTQLKRTAADAHTRRHRDPDLTDRNECEYTSAVYRVHRNCSCTGGVLPSAISPPPPPIRTTNLNFIKLRGI